MVFKNFCRTTLGRLVLYMTFVISGLAVVLSGVEIILANGFQLYFNDYENASTDYIYSRHFYDEMEQYVVEYGMNYLCGIPGGASVDFPLVISDEKSDILAIYNAQNLDREVQQVICKVYFSKRGNSGDILIFNDYQAAITNRLNDPLCQQIISVEAYYGEGLVGNSSIQGGLAALKIADTFKYAVYPIGVVAIILFICSFVFLMAASGHKEGINELVPGLFTRFPADILFVLTSAIIGGLLVGWIMFMDEIGGSMQYLWGTITVSILVAAACLFLFAAFCSSVAARIKLKSLIKDTLVYKICSFISRKVVSLLHAVKYLFTNLPSVPKAILIMAGIAIFEFFGLIICSNDFDILIVIWVIEKLVFTALVLFFAIGLNKLRMGGERIASGEDVVIDKKWMWGDMVKHADNLSSISLGMNKAVTEKLKSERMKTELIANVSHDIKTPLTSIINYAGLVAGEKTSNPKIKEYSDVLIKQSEKLKKLIEDLVEASRAGSGNLEVDLVPCDAGTFISQASGEYEEKMSKVKLTLICNQPETETMINADPRRMWRVFDNLMNNICKYSLENSRVYLTLTKTSEEAIIEFKNTSRDELNISTEELMERFVRGDKSRNTDGNGLGLSIAQSLTALQGGELKITIDGDLFKATLRFPLAK